MKKIFVLLITIVFSQTVFSAWEMEHDIEYQGYAYLRSVNTNMGSAWIEIWTNGKDFFSIHLDFQDAALPSGNNKIEYKLGKEKTKLITGYAEGATGGKFVKGCRLFSTSRNAKSTLDFIEELLTNDSISIKFNDYLGKTHTFIFNISNLEEAFEEISEQY